MKRSSNQLNLHMGCGEALTAKPPLQRQRMVDVRRGRAKSVVAKAGKGRR